MAGDLSVTALYTSAVWCWGELSHAHLFATPEAKRVFDVTNLALMLKPGASLLPYALLQRHAMLDHLLAGSGVKRVIELAAGLSRRGAAFARELDYTEVDLPPVIARKRALLERTGEGREVLTHLRLVAGDVASVRLEALAPRGEPLFVIAEGLVPYLARDARRQLFAKVRALAEHSGSLRFAFDLVPESEEPAPGVVGRLLELAMKRFTGGRAFERDAKTRADVLAELARAGFTTAEARAPHEVTSSWGLPHPAKKTTMVVFSAAWSG